MSIKKESDVPSFEEEKPPVCPIKKEDNGHYTKDIIYQLVPTVPVDPLSTTQGIIKSEPKTNAQDIIHQLVPTIKTEHVLDSIKQDPLIDSKDCIRQLVPVIKTETTSHLLDACKPQDCADFKQNALRTKTEFADNKAQADDKMKEMEVDDEDVIEVESNDPMPCGFCSLYFSLPSILRTHRQYCSARHEADQSPSDIENQQQEIINTKESKHSVDTLTKHHKWQHNEEDGLLSDTEEDNKHKCKVCDYTTNTVDCLIQHLTEHGVVLHVCQFCDKYFYTKNDFFKHAELHKEYYTCNLCGFHGDSKAHLVEHLTTHVKLETYKCRICYFETVLSNDFDAHTERHIDVKNCKCQPCDKVFNTINKLIDHMKNIHFNMKIYTCKECDASYNARFITKHMMTHAVDILPYKCDLCSFRTKSRCKLPTHRMCHTGEKPYACSLCDFKTTNRFYLVHDHMKIHTTEKTHKCDLCDFNSKTLDQLRQHIKRHLGERKVQCRTCSKRFISATKLSKHKEKCKGKKKLCNICGKLFVDYSYRNQHMKIHHSDLKEFECDICGFKCKTKVNIAQHIANHMGQKRFQCDVCGYKTGRRGNFTKHVRIHTGEAPYKCNICDYKTANCSNFKTHQKMHKRKLV